MNKKKLENWTWWIITNLASIPLNFYKHLVFTSFQYLVFLILAVMGYITWRKKIRHGSRLKKLWSSVRNHRQKHTVRTAGRTLSNDWVPEFARKYLLELGRPYNYDDLLDHCQKDSSNWKTEMIAASRKYRYLLIPICM